MLEHGHNHYLVAASFGIALMAGFTGLSLTRGASTMTLAQRKFVVAISAVALGSGVWSMHFVAMLGLRLPFEFYYDALTTMISAFVAILLTGIALLIVHFGERTPQRIVLAGACVGIGIAAMHYLGMSGMKIAQPVFSAFGVVISLISSLVLCIISFWICYGERNARNIYLGTIGFGVAVFAVHFIAMAGTHFVQIDTADNIAIRLDNEVLAFGVTLSSFAISGAFLLVGVTFNTNRSSRIYEPEVTSETQDVEPQTESLPDSAITDVPVADVRITDARIAAGRIPYEKNGRVNFVQSNEVAAVRAEGHYTILYHKSGKLFCPWAISKFETQDVSPNFIKCHRSYFINCEHVTEFERNKDNGICYFADEIPLDKAPVSRSYLKKVREKLGL